MNHDYNDYKDRTLLLKVIGIILLLSGIVSGFLGTLEVYCFYLFSAGGKFNYEGFGFGSFMFNNIACQVIGYYLIAAILTPIGFGHLKMKKWARHVSLTVIWSWLVVGLPLIIAAFFILTGTKGLSIPAALIVLIILALSYLVVPGLLIRLYNSRNIISTLENKDRKDYPIERVPIRILIISLLYLFYIIMLHILIMFNGIFPVFGIFVFGLEGIILLDITIFCFYLLAWGTIQRRIWAWWGSIVIVGIFTLSAVITLLKTRYLDILSGLRFPQSEIGFLAGIPIQGYHLAIMVGIPLSITWILVILSKRDYVKGNNVV